MPRIDQIEIESMYRTLSVPNDSTGEDRFNAFAVPGIDGYRIGRDGRGRPALLISVAPGAGQGYAPALRLERIEVQHNALCEISRGIDDPVAERLTVVRCTSTDVAPYFVRICSSIIASLGSDPDQDRVTETIDRLVRLFQSMTNPPRNSVQGLWGELFVIATARDPLRLVDAWRVEATDRFDFSSTNQRVEVKTSTGFERKHHFSLDQLRPPVGVAVKIASLFVDRAGGGRSVADLMDQIHTKIRGAGRASLRVEQVVVSTLGVAFRSGVNERFDFEHASQTLRFYDALDIPSVSPQLPREVSRVRFECDLADTPAVASWPSTDDGSLFAAIM